MRCVARLRAAARRHVFQLSHHLRQAVGDLGRDDGGLVDEAADRGDGDPGATGDISDGGVVGFGIHRNVTGFCNRLHCKREEQACQGCKTKGLGFMIRTESGDYVWGRLR